MRRTAQRRVDGVAVFHVRQGLAEAHIIKGRLVHRHVQAGGDRAAEVDDGHIFVIQESANIVAGRHRAPPIDVARFQRDHRRRHIGHHAEDNFVQAGVDVIILVGAQDNFFIGRIRHEFEGTGTKRIQAIVIAVVLDGFLGDDGGEGQTTRLVVHDGVRTAER